MPPSSIELIFAEAHRLKAAGISQNRAAKAHESRDSAHLMDQLGAGADRQMVGVGEDQAVAHAPQFIGRHRLDRGARSDRHKARRRDLAMRRDETAHACVAVGRADFELERRAHQLKCSDSFIR